MTLPRSFPQRYTVALLLAAACSEPGEYDEDLDEPSLTFASSNDENGQDIVVNFGEADSEDFPVYVGSQMPSVSAGTHEGSAQEEPTGIGLISSALTVSAQTFSSTAGTEMTEPAAGIIVVSAGDEQIPVFTNQSGGGAGRNDYNCFRDSYALSAITI